MFLETTYLLSKIHIFVYKRGASTHSNLIGIDSMLRNMYTPLNRDHVKYTKNNVSQDLLIKGLFQNA